MSSLAVLDEVLETIEKKQEEEKPKKDLGKAPPKDGICKRCGNDRPINRLMLCYKCWVITNLEDEAKARGEVWTPNMPHPSWCKCEGIGGHPERQSSGN